MKIKILIWIGIIVIVLVVLTSLNLKESPFNSPLRRALQLDRTNASESGEGITGKAINVGNFAKCLTEKDVKMYGAYWCSHCNNQKQMFGENWKYVDYIECSLPDNSGQTEICKAKGIKAYPTWEFKEERVEGELSLEQLSEKSGCRL